MISIVIFMLFDVFITMCNYVIYNINAIHANDRIIIVITVLCAAVFMVSIALFKVVLLNFDTTCYLSLSAIYHYKLMPCTPSSIVIHHFVFIHLHFYTVIFHINLCRM